MHKTLFFLFALGVLLLDSCYYDNAEELYPNAFCDTANVTYSQTIEPIILTQCATPGCHVTGGTGTGDLTVFANVAEIAANGKLVGTINRQADYIAMPPNGSLSSCAIKQIEQWVASGAPNN